MVETTERLTYRSHNPQFQRATIEVAPRYLQRIKTNAKRLNLLHLGDRLFCIQHGCDRERVLQAVEGVLDGYDAEEGEN